MVAGIDEHQADIQTRISKACCSCGVLKFIDAKARSPLRS